MQARLFITFILLFSLVRSTNAQLCQGSLGDPIVNITFGSGANPGSPLQAATTTYQYVGTDCPNDGFYTVRNNTISCFSNSWHSLTSDHTGDPNGYFMLINASFNPGAFYLDTVRGLCGNSTYEFAAWIMNVLLPSSCNSSGIQPNLTFSIERTDGTVLQSYNSGSIATSAAPAWRQYGFFFTTPAGVSDIVLRIVNNAQGGCGNDIALDDITFRPCGPQLVPAIAGNTSTTVSLCEGTAGNYTFNCTVSGGFTNPVYQWQERFNAGTWNDIPGQTTTSLTRNFPASTPVGSYQYRLAVAEAGNMGSMQCRITSLPLTVQINALPVTSATNNGPACEHTTIMLTATGGTQYAWTGPNGFTGSGSPLQVGSIQMSHAGKYYVTVTNAAGCSKLDSTTIVVNPAPVASTTFSSATICLGDSVQLIGNGGPPYQWIPAVGLSNAAVFNPKASPVATTTYQLVVNNLLNCRDTTEVVINVATKPVVNAGPDRTILTGQSIGLSGSVSGGANSFSWLPSNYISDIFTLQPIVNPPTNAQYILTAVSTSGCGVSSDTVLVRVYNDLYIPNVFTPNADGKNDTWNIPALEAYPGFELFIFDRYGRMIFKTNSVPVAWDGTCQGKPCVNGTYVYVIRLAGGKELVKGTVMILR